MTFLTITGISRYDNLESKQGDDDENRNQNAPNQTLIPFQEKQNNRAQKRESDSLKESKNSTLDKITESVVIDAKGRAKTEPNQRQSKAATSKGE